MNKFSFVCLILFIPFSIFSDIVFPESLYVIDTESSYKIMLGVSPEFIEKEYGEPNDKKLRYKFSSPNYEIWSMTYDGFEIWYDTYDKMITSIEILNQSFCTSKYIKIGDPLSKIIQLYGAPNYISKNIEGEEIYDYNGFFKEINLDGEYTSLQFIISDGKIIKIFIAIISEV